MLKRFCIPFLWSYVRRDRIPFVMRLRNECVSLFFYLRETQGLYTDRVKDKIVVSVYPLFFMCM